MLLKFTRRQCVQYIIILWAHVLSIIIVLALSNGNKCTPHGLLHSAGPGGPVPLSTVGGYKFIQSTKLYLEDSLLGSIEALMMGGLNNGKNACNQKMDHVQAQVYSIDEQPEHVHDYNASCR